MGALIDDTVGLYVTDDTPNAEPRYRARFYFDPNSVTMASGDTHYLFKAYQGTSTEVLRVEFRFSSGNYELRLGLIDNGTAWSYTGWFTLSDAPHYIEWDWRAASNGGLTLWIDGAQQADITTVNNDGRRIDRARLGPLSGLDTGTSGTYYFDSFESRRENYIGPVASGGSNLALGNNAGRVDGARPSYRNQHAVQANRSQNHFVNYRLQPPQQSGSTFTPVADAYVDGANPTSNYGTSTTLRTDASPDLHSYLRFDVQGLTGTVTSATLRIYANSSSSVGYTVSGVSDNTWTESTINHNNAPVLGSSLGSSGAITAATWTSVDVTSYITGNGAYNFAFSTTSSTNISFSSREGANAPQLVIVTSDGATNTPTATATAGPSPTPPNTGVATPTKTATPTATTSQPPTVTPATPPPFQNATFVYDGDGKRVKSTINGTITTYFIGAHYEVSGSTITKYYYAGSQRIAMRTNNTLNYLLGDHLGSTSLTTDAAGNKVSELHYKAWGEVRYASGNMPTKYTYTGQYSDSYINLLWYGSRHYDPELGRFIQPDSIVPLASQGVQAWDRYAYVNNAPTKYTDPTGHMIDDGYVGNQRRLDCQKYGQYCNNGKPKSSAELLAMRRPPQPEPRKPWVFNLPVNLGFHMGPTRNANTPNFNGETENGANVPYFPGGNLNPNLCVGRGGALLCAASLITSFTFEYGPTNVDPNFFVTFDVNYNELTGMTMSEIHYTNYSELAVLGETKINNTTFPGGSSYMPTDGTYQSIPNSGGVYNGNSPIYITLVVNTAQQTSRGIEPMPNYRFIIIPSLLQMMDYTQR